MIIKLKGREIDVRIEEKSIKITDAKDKNEIEMTKDEFVSMAGLFFDTIKHKIFKKG